MPPVIKQILGLLGQILRVLGLGLLALLILFEEWGWESLHQALVWLGRLRLVRRLESAIAALGPRAALVLFAIPTVLLLPIKLLALALIGQGHALWGTLVIVLAKVLGTALVARLFSLTRPALMQMSWFACGYGRWMAWKQALLAKVRASAVWRAGRSAKRAVQAQWQRWWPG